MNILTLNDLKSEAYQKIISEIHKMMDNSTCKQDNYCQGRGGTWIGGTKHGEYPWAILNANLKTGMQVLDAGCGPSPLPIYLEKRYQANVTAVDINDRDFIPNTAFGTSVDYRAMNLESLDFNDGTFDRIFNISTIEHIKNDTRALNEMFRTLKLGGYLLLTSAISVKGDKETYSLERFKNLLKHYGITINSVTWDFSYASHFKDCRPDVLIPCVVIKK